VRGAYVFVLVSSCFVLIEVAFHRSHNFTNLGSDLS
jgi:hypothetical protein